MPKFAIIETGSKQYRVEPQSVIEVEILKAPEGQKEIVLEKVLLVNDGEKLSVGTPYLQGAKVVCDCLGNLRAPKVINFKYRKRKKSSRKVGHRQTYTKLQVKEIIG